MVDDTGMVCGVGDAADGGASPSLPPTAFRPDKSWIACPFVGGEGFKETTEEHVDPNFKKAPETNPKFEEAAVADPIFEKAAEKKITRADWNAKGPPYIPQRYAELDAILA